MRIIIAGSRTFYNYKKLEKICDKIIYDMDIPDVTVISGGAVGTDQLGELYAKRTKLKLIKMLANWNLYGKSAGYRRNEEMAKYASEDNGVLIAFWNGESKGTKHMIKLAKKYGLRIFIERI